MGELLSRESTQFPIEASALFAAHSAALSIAYIRAERNLVDDNVTPDGYLKALSHVAEWELGDREEFVAEIISLVTLSASLYMVNRQIRDSSAGSLFPGARSRADRNKDDARIADVARVLLDFVQGELTRENLKAH